MRGIGIGAPSHGQKQKNRKETPGLDSITGPARPYPARMQDHRVRADSADDALPAHKRDYAAMAEMFMGDVPDFDAVMSGLAALQAKLNG